MPTLFARLTCVALGFAGAAGLGCVLYVEDVDCGPYAYAYRGSCYCDDGYDGEDPYGEGCYPIMTWRLTDACDDGADVAWKLFSQDRDWTWPSGDGVYVTRGFNYDSLESILCERGELVCLGAQSDSGLEYGVGIDGSAGCQDCCFECDAYELDFGFLTCQ